MIRPRRSLFTLATLAPLVTLATLAPVALVITGTVLMVRGLWIPAKAQLAQVLLERAWLELEATSGQQASLAESSPTVIKPWPWADTWPVARLELQNKTGTLSGGKPVRGRRKSLVVLEGASGQALAFGPGLVRKSESNIVIAGHRDTHFATLEHAAPGDALSLRFPGELARHYRVTGTAIVHRNDTWPLHDPPQVELLTLVTCYPFDAVVPGGPLRFVVQAERLGPVRPQPVDTKASRSR